MNKKIKKSLLTLVSLMGISFLSGCKNNENNGKEDDKKPTEHTHEFTNYVSDNNATCTSDGTKTAKCNGCDATDTKADSNSKKGHSYTNYVSDNNATCTADGTKTAKCDRCDATDTKADTGSKKEHTYATTYSYDENYHWYNATCGCDLVSGKEAHTFGEPVIVEATSQKIGSKTFTCKCGYSYNEEIPYIFTEKVVSEATFRAPATCNEPKSYFYTDKDGNLGKEYFYVGEPNEHDFNYTVKNGKVVLTCKNCDFDSSKDYSNKNDNELTNENIADIVLNSSFTISSKDEDYAEYRFFMGSKFLYLYGDSCNILNNPYDYYFSKVRQVNNANVYINDYCYCYLEDGEYKINYDDSALYGENNELYYDNEFECCFGDFRYVYNSETGTYETHYYNSRYGDKYDIGFKIENKQIVDYYNLINEDEYTYDFSNEEAPEKFLNILEDYQGSEVVEKDGVFTAGRNYCEHDYCFYYKDATHDKAYAVCKTCGYSTLNCGDYSNVDDDKLTDAQLMDLLLNTEYAYRPYAADDDSGYNEFYYCNNGLFLKLHDDELNWNLYRNVNESYNYYEYGCSYLGAGISKNGSHGADVQESNVCSWSDSNANSYALMYYDYDYDPSSGVYKYEDDNVFSYIKVENGKIVDLWYQDCSDIYYRLDSSSLATMSQYYDTFSEPYYTVEDRIIEEGKFYIMNGDEIYGTIDAGVLGMNLLTPIYKQFIKDEYGYEIADGFNEYQQINTNDGSYSYFSIGAFGLYYNYFGEEEFNFEASRDRIDLYLQENIDKGVTKKTRYSYGVDCLGNIKPLSSTISITAKDMLQDVSVTDGVQYEWSDTENDFVVSGKFHTVKNYDENITISDQVERIAPITNEFYLSYSLNRDKKGDLFVVTETYYSGGYSPDDLAFITYPSYKSIVKYDSNNRQVSSEWYEYKISAQGLVPQGKRTTRYEGENIVEDINYAWDSTKNDWCVTKYYLKETIDNVFSYRNFEIDWKGDVAHNEGYDITFDVDNSILATINYSFDRETNTWVVVEE